MRDITLSRNASIETVLPWVEAAMESGEICRINHIDCLGQLGIAALKTLAMANCLMDSASGRLVHAQPGFELICIDGSGVARIMR